MRAGSTCHFSCFAERLICCGKNGGAGYRSPYFSHAKRALYHLSYTPDIQAVGTSTESMYRRVIGADVDFFIATGMTGVNKVLWRNG